MINLNDLDFKEAILEGLPSIVNIYNDVINEGGFTADLVPYSVQAKTKWFLSLSKNASIFVVVLEARIIGYFYFSPWREGRDALKTTSEISFYIDKNYRGKGIGNKILINALKVAKKKGIENLIAILLDTNTASIGLLEKYGFKIAGHLPDIVNLKAKQCGQYIMLKKL